MTFINMACHVPVILSTSDKFVIVTVVRTCIIALHMRRMRSFADGTFVFVTLWIHCLNMIVPCHLLVAHTTPDVHILLLHNTERLPKTEQAGVAPLFVINKRFHRLLSLSFSPLYNQKHTWKAINDKTMNITGCVSRQCMVIHGV